MLKIYDSKGDSFPLSDYEDFCITHKLDGCDKMSFILDVRHKQYPLLFEEQQIESENNVWIIKKIDDDKIDCELDFDFLKQKVYTNYKSETMSLQEVLEGHLPIGWTVESSNVSSIRRTIEFDFCTDFDVLYQCMNTYNVYFVWKMKEKRLVIYSAEKMQTTGEYLTSELNLTALSFKGDTTEFATRLYAYGKDGLTMEDAMIEKENGETVRYGLTYVENRSYVDKLVCAYWSDDRYTVPENLKNDAEEKLATISFPVRSYECDVIDLAKQNERYSFLDFKMHKKVTLIDVDRNIRVEHQIVEYVEYPEESDRNKVTLSCVPDTIQTAVTNAVSSTVEISEKMKTTFEERLAMATAMLTGAFGGYVKNTGSEILILDNEDPALAEIVWRWNINGFGKSSTGIDGPYTTAMTFDDEFITNVINAMVIRGSLIEADSITATSISQSYTDDVLDQSFTAAEGLVKAMFSNISEYLTNESGNGKIDVIESSITQIQETIDGLKLSFEDSYIGGINYVYNSSGLNGISEDWISEGVVTTSTNDDTKNSTISNSCFVLSANSSLKQIINNIIIGNSYSISLKAKKTSPLLSEIKVIYNGNQEAVIFSSSNSSGWNEYFFTINNIQSTNIEFQATTRSNYLYISDIMICEGNFAKSWTPAPNEIYTNNVKIDKTGIEVYRSDSTEKTVMNSHEFAGYYKDEMIFSLNKDETRIKKTIIDGELSVGDAKIIPYKYDDESGINITLID